MFPLEVSSRTRYMSGAGPGTDSSASTKYNHIRRFYRSRLVIWELGVGMYVRMPGVKAFTLAVLALASAFAPAFALRPRAASAGKPHWTSQTSGVTARLRGVSAVSDKVAWASGAGGTVLRTADGGTTWQRLIVPDARRLDFRDVDAVSETTAYVL